MLSLSGKHCVVTGGSRGIGLAIAKLFASEGATCTLVGRHRETLIKAVSSLEQSPHVRLHSHEVFSVASERAWQLLIDRFKKERIDILVNAAGVSLDSLLYRTDLDALQETLDVNLKGTILGCRFVIPKMMRQNEGCIINVSSILASHGGRGASVYAATKAGIIALTRSLAWEVGRFNIRANVIQPGYINTDMTAAMADKRDIQALIPMRRLGLVGDVAEAAAFLAKNSYAHNCVLRIDGGLSAT
ncbi:NAD(P)-binding protein [Xylaria intraflava]|nr:NAD(P)-binding protein [Xylaria intraflava]